MATIRALLANDDRSRFSSGDADLDRFFQKYAGQNQFRHHIGTTYVVVEHGLSLAYASVSPGSLAIDELPAGVAKKLPRYPMPVLRLARLAVDTSRQGRGVGSELLRFVLRLAVDMAGTLGCLGVVVDAKPGAVGFYEAYGFRAVEALEGESAARPRPAAMFLPLKDIVAATRGSK